VLLHSYSCPEVESICPLLVSRWPCDFLWSTDYGKSNIEPILSIGFNASILCLETDICCVNLLKLINCMIEIYGPVTLGASVTKLQNKWVRGLSYAASWKICHPHKCVDDLVKNTLRHPRHSWPIHSWPHTHEQAQLKSVKPRITKTAHWPGNLWKIIKWLLC